MLGQRGLKKGEGQNHLKSKTMCGELGADLVCPRTFFLTAPNHYHMFAESANSFTVVFTLCCYTHVCT